MRFVDANNLLLKALAQRTRISGGMVQQTKRTNGVCT